MKCSRPWIGCTPDCKFEEGRTRCRLHVPPASIMTAMERRLDSTSGPWVAVPKAELVTLLDCLTCLIDERNNPTLIPAKKLSDDEIKALNDEGTKVREELEKRFSSMTR